MPYGGVMSLSGYGGVMSLSGWHDVPQLNVQKFFLGLSATTQQTFEAGHCTLLSQATACLTSYLHHMSHGMSHEMLHAMLHDKIGLSQDVVDADHVYRWVAPATCTASIAVTGTLMVSPAICSQQQQQAAAAAAAGSSRQQQQQQQAAAAGSSSRQQQ